jgi:hypothetical protein
VALFSTGVTYRGPYSPWAVMLDRTAAVAVGVRPVWRMSDDALAATESAAKAFRQEHPDVKINWGSPWEAEMTEPDGAQRLAAITRGASFSLDGW